MGKGLRNGDSLKESITYYHNNVVNLQVVDSTNEKEENHTTTPFSSLEGVDIDVDISDLDSLFCTPRVIQMERTIKTLENRLSLQSKKIKLLQLQHTRAKKIKETFLAIINEVIQKHDIATEIEAALGADTQVAEFYKRKFKRKNTITI